MDIKELDKKQLILLTLLITFVVSIVTGIVTVSLMNQMPKSVPQTINNVIQRTIEKVTTVETPVTVSSNSGNTKYEGFNLDGGNIVVSLYLKDGEIPAIINNGTTVITPTGTGEVISSNTNSTAISTSKELGQGVIISDVGLVMVDSSILTESKVYKITLNKIDFDATILKKFNNGFTVLKISEKKAVANSGNASASVTPKSTTN